MKPLVIVTGPTAVGKTALSLLLAKRIGGEIVSADSMQVYRHMDIGTAKISTEEMQGIPHHMIDILEPEEDFNVFTFQSMAKRYLEGVFDRGNIPIITGGTGFYIQALLYDINFTDNAPDDSYRQELERLGEERGNAYLHAMLKDADPDSAAIIHENNRKRIIRALVFQHDTGLRISQHNSEERKRSSPYNFCYFVLQDDRVRLYQRINQRVDTMIADGLVDEVIKLRNRGCGKDMVSMQGLGYKEIFSYLEGEISIDEAVNLIKRDTRHFAKRQLTWFRREKDVIWIPLEDYSFDTDRIVDKMCQVLKDKGIASDNNSARQ